MRLSIALVFLLMSSLVFFGSIGQAGPPGGKTPLDLPSGGKAPDDDSEEDAPETILFYGSEFEGDSFFWCFPAYGFCGETTTFNAIKGEVTSGVSQLSENSTFSLVAFNSQTYVWSLVGKKANAANKASALSWMVTLVPIEAHCIKEAALTALGISQTASSERKQMILCGAREPYCNGNGGPEYVNGALAEITNANYETTPIHTIYFSTSFYNGESYFYQQLATMNGGTFREVGY